MSWPRAVTQTAIALRAPGSVAALVVRLARWTPASDLRSALLQVEDDEVVRQVAAAVFAGADVG